MKRYDFKDSATDQHSDYDKERQYQEKLLERKISEMRFVMVIEQIWPKLWGTLSVIGIFLLITLSGLWSVLPHWAHKLFLALFALGFLVSFIPIILFRKPKREAILKRLEQDSNFKHSILRTYEDKISYQRPSHITQNIWQAHQKKIAEQFANLKVLLPKPRVSQYDPYALRTLLILLLIVGFIAAGDLFSERFKSVFNLQALDAKSNYRIDAWVTPPAYTGKAPIMLLDGSKVRSTDKEENDFIEVPENSELIVRISGDDVDAFHVKRSIETYRNYTTPNYRLLEKAPQKQDISKISQYKYKLKDALDIIIQNGALTIHEWRFNILQDAPPNIRLTKPLKITARKAVHLTYHLSDDYGVVSAKAKFSRLNLSGKNGEKAQRKNEVSYGIPPEFPLVFPPSSDKTAQARTYKNLTSHPWAGLPVEVVLSAKDDAGQVSKTQPVMMVLPQRVFKNPLAKAIIEQRRILVDKPKSNYLRVAQSLHALSLSPENFIKDIKVYLGLRSVYWRMQYNPHDSIKSVVDQLWNIAVYIEDGDLSDAERQMKLAQDRLEKALREGASGSEIKKLLDDLRTAVSRFIQSMAEKMQSQAPQNIPQNPNGQGQQISAKELDQMLRNIEEFAKSGARNMASQMLNQLRDLLENLQANQGQPNASNRNAMSTLEDLGNLIRQQQKLLDQTYQQNQRTRQRQSGRSLKGEQSQRLSDQQRALQDLLGQITKSMQGAGMKPGKSLGQAGKAMGEAQQSLGDQNLGRAAQQQTHALDQLRKGAQNAANQFLQQFRQQARRQGGQRDPFGRPLPQRSGPDFGGDRVKIPENFDVQKAREILDELRKRFSDTKRPPLELDYLERLLKLF